MSNLRRRASRSTKSSSSAAARRGPAVRGATGPDGRRGCKADGVEADSLPEGGVAARRGPAVRGATRRMHPVFLSWHAAPVGAKAAATGKTQPTRIRIILIIAFNLFSVII